MLIINSDTEIKMENNFWLHTNLPYVFINGDDDGLFLIKELHENSFEYLDQRFFTKISIYDGYICNVVRLANEKERLAGRRL